MRAYYIMVMLVNKKRREPRMSYLFDARTKTKHTDIYSVTVPKKAQNEAIKKEIGGRVSRDISVELLSALSGMVKAMSRNFEDTAKSSDRE